MKCAIIDDEPLALGLLESYVAKTPMLELCGKYASAVEAMGGLQSNPVDIIFLDIQMPDLNGLDFSKTIDTARTRIIFTTAFSQYALEGYKVKADKLCRFRCISKPCAKMVRYDGGQAQ